GQRPHRWAVGPVRVVDEQRERLAIGEPGRQPEQTMHDGIHIGPRDGAAGPEQRGDEGSRTAEQLLAPRLVELADQGREELARQRKVDFTIEQLPAAIDDVPHVPSLPASPRASQLRRNCNVTYDDRRAKVARRSCCEWIVDVCPSLVSRRGTCCSRR